MSDPTIPDMTLTAPTSENTMSTDVQWSKPQGEDAVPPPLEPTQEYRDREFSASPEIIVGGG